jgi:hypothetical protein
MICGFTGRFEMDKTERRALVREYNGLRAEVKALSAKLERMEQHEGDDGIAEDIDGQCALVDVIAEKHRRIRELQRLIYPKE